MTNREINTLSEESIRRIAREVFKSERTAIESVGSFGHRPMIGRRNDGVRFRNDSGETVPPYGVMEITAYDHATKIYTITKPTTTRAESGWLVNGKNEVLDQALGNGEFGFDRPIPVLVGSTNEHTSHCTFAPKAGYWHLSAGSNTAVTGGDLQVFDTQEDAGFRHVYWGMTGSTLTMADYPYDYGDGTSYVVGRLFVQQLEQPELSAIIGIDTDSYWNSYAGTSDGYIGNNITYIYLKPDDTTDETYTRCGIEKHGTVNGSSQKIFSLTRPGLYQIELFGTLKLYDVDNESYSVGKTDSGGDTYYLYPQNPTLVDIQLYSVNIHNNYRWHKVWYESVLPNYKTETAFRQVYAKTFLEFDVANNNSTIDVAVIVHAITTSDNPKAKFIKGDADAASSSRRTPCFLKITRLRMGTHVKE